jgi:hypothetical protein
VPTASSTGAGAAHLAAYRARGDRDQCRLAPLSVRHQYGIAVESDRELRNRVPHMLETVMSSTENDIAYFAKRALQERDSADQANDPCARQTHLRMAEEYERRAENPGPRATVN